MIKLKSASLLLTCALIICWMYLPPVATAANAPSYPCSYSQTVNITDGRRLTNGSYSFEDLLIPANLTAEYTFEVIDGIEYSAPRHIRGCVCLLKPCITFCCPAKFRYDEQYHNCTLDERNLPFEYDQVLVTLPNSKRIYKNITDMFIVRYEFGYKTKYIEKTPKENGHWDLYENGSLKVQKIMYTTKEYCLSPVKVEGNWSLTPLTYERLPQPVYVYIYCICTSVAIIVNIIIILLFVAVKDVRNSNYGQGLIFHLSTLTIGMMFLLYLHVKNPINLSHTRCHFIVSTAHYFIIGSFLILNVISGSFWVIFAWKPIKNWNLCMLYCLAVAITFTLNYLAFSEIKDSNINYNLKPGIGEDSCWFNVRWSGIFLYLHLPITVSLLTSCYCSFNAYICILKFPTGTVNICDKDSLTIKRHFMSYCIYLLMLFSVSMFGIVIDYMYRLSHTYYLIDYWNGICMLCLSLVAFIFLLTKNYYVRNWCRTIVGGPLSSGDEITK